MEAFAQPNGMTQASRNLERFAGWQTRQANGFAEMARGRN